MIIEAHKQLLDKNAIISVKNESGNLQNTDPWKLNERRWKNFQH